MSYASTRFEVHALPCLRHGTPLLKPLSFSVNAGELLHLQGPNGIGKSTLLQRLSGLNPAFQDMIHLYIEGVSVDPLDYCQHVAYLPHALGLRWEYTLDEHLQWSLALQGLSWTRTQRSDFWERYHFSSRQHLPVQQLSYGQQKRFAWALLQIRQPLLWLLDEPFSGLDAAYAQQLTADLEALLNAQRLVIVTSHQPLTINTHRIHTLSLEAHRAEPSSPSFDDRSIYL